MEHKFILEEKAVEKALQMKKLYGYQPQVFKVSKGGNTQFVVIEPLGLKKIVKR